MAALSLCSLQATIKALSVGQEPQKMLFVYSGKFPDLGSSAVQELAIFAHFLDKQLEITLFGLPYSPSV